MPAAVFLIDPAGHIIVIQCDNGSNPRCQQFVDQIVIKSDSHRVYLTIRCRNNTGPGNRKTVAGKPAFLHQSHVLFIMVVVIRYHRIICIRLFGLRIQIDNRRSAAILGSRPLYLPCSAGGSPQKAFWKYRIL